MKIVVRLLTGQSFILESESTDTIEHIKEKVYPIIRTPPEGQRILYSGKQLEDGRTLADYSVKEGRRFDVVIRLSGGASGEIERPLARQNDKPRQNDKHEIYNIYYGDAFQSGWRDKHDKELLQLLLKDGTISGGNIKEEAWLSIQNGLNNSQNCNFEIDFLKERLREYNQWYSLLVETSSSIFHWDLANKFIRVKSDELDYKMPLSRAQMLYLKCLRMLIHGARTMKIVIRLHNGQSFILESESTDTIDHIKAKVHSITDITTDAQGIIYLGSLLDDGNMSLASLNVKEGSMLVVNRRIRGGGPGVIERPRREQEDVNECYNIYNIYYGDAFQSGWTDEHNKELLQLLLKDGTISGGNIQEAAWLSIQNCLNNSQNCNFEIDFLKERLREYNQWYSLLVETSSSIFHWDLANKFIRVKSDELDYEMPLSGAQLSYLKCLQMLVHQDISLLSNIRTKFQFACFKIM